MSVTYKSDMDLRIGRQLELDVDLGVLNISKKVTYRYFPVGIKYFLIR